MKKFFSLAVLPLTLCLFSNIATAELIKSGNVRFEGKVTPVAKTCSFATGSNGQTIRLDDISASNLVNAGAVDEGSKDFSIKFDTCTAPKVAINFHSMNVNSATGNLKNRKTGGAGNVEIALFNNNSKINLSDANQNLPVINIANGKGQIDLKAKYSSNGQATAGEVASFAMFKVTYP